MADLALYYYEQAGQPAGPLQADELLAHGVQPATLVWQTGMEVWVPADSVSELRELFVPQPPPLPGNVAGENISPASLALPLTLAAPSMMPVSAPTPAAARPQFSAEGGGTHKWWHFLLLAVVIVFCLLFARACGVVLSQLLGTATTPPPALTGVLTELPTCCFLAARQPS